MRILLSILLFCSLAASSQSGGVFGIVPISVATLPAPDTTNPTNDTILPPATRQHIIAYSGWENGLVTDMPAPWQNAGFNPYVQEAQTGLVTRSTDFAFAGTYSMKCVVDHSVTYATGEGHSQLSFINQLSGQNYGQGKIGEGEEYWYGGAVYLPASYVSTDAEFIRQWHHDDSNGSPPMGLMTNTGHFYWDYITTNGGSDNFIDLGAYTTGVWTRIVIHIKHSSNPAIAVTQIWINGVKKMDLSATGLQGPAANKFAGLNNITMVGLYKWLYKLQTASTSTRTIYWDEFRIGDSGATYADVAP